MMKNETILLIHMTDEQRALIQNILKQFGDRGLMGKVVLPDEEDAPLALLAGWPTALWRRGAQEQPHPRKIEEAMLVFCGIKDPLFDALLRALRENGARGLLKAVLTETNALWSAKQLYGELCAERDSLHE